MTRAKDISKITTAPTMGGLTYPTSDGSNGQFVKTDGSGNLSFATVSTTTAFDDVTAGDAAVNVTTTSGNITIDAQGSDTDIIFKGTDGSSDITALTLDMSDAGTAIFNHNVRLATDNAILNVGNDDDIALTHNGTNGSLTSGGNFNLTIGTDLTLDAGGTISLDADSGSINLLDGGTTHAELINSSNDFVIKSSQPDKDIIFKGVDGSSLITALTLDMSEAGDATFNSNIRTSAIIVQSSIGSGGIARQTTASGSHAYTPSQFRNSSGSVVGSIGSGTSATSFNTTSDYRLKESITYDFDATSRLKQLKPARFNFIIDADTTVDGFIAHEVSSIVPEAITGTKDATQEIVNVVLNADGSFLADNISEKNWTKGKLSTTDDDGNTVDPIYASDTTWVASKTVPKYQGIDQSKLVPLLTKTILELEARITALESA